MSSNSESLSINLHRALSASMSGVPSMRYSSVPYTVMSFDWKIPDATSAAALWYLVRSEGVKSPTRMRLYPMVRMTLHTCDWLGLEPEPFIEYQNVRSPLAENSSKMPPLP